MHINANSQPSNTTDLIFSFQRNILKTFAPHSFQTLIQYSLTNRLLQTLVSNTNYFSDFKWLPRIFLILKPFYRPIHRRKKEPGQYVLCSQAWAVSGLVCVKDCWKLRASRKILTLVLEFWRPSTSICTSYWTAKIKTSIIMCWIHSSASLAFR